VGDACNIFETTAVESFLGVKIIYILITHSSYWDWFVTVGDMLVS